MALKNIVPAYKCLKLKYRKYVFQTVVILVQFAPTTFILSIALQYINKLTTVIKHKHTRQRAAQIRHKINQYFNILHNIANFSPKIRQNWGFDTNVDNFYKQNILKLRLQNKR